MSTPSTDPGDVVTAFCDAWNRGDVDAIVGAFTDDAVYHNIPMDPAVGREAIEGFIRGFFDGAGSIGFETLHQAVNGNIVLNERVDTIVMGDRTTALPVMGVFEVTGDGKISAWRDYFDMAMFTGG